MAQLKRIALEVGQSCNLDLAWLEACETDQQRLPQKYYRASGIEYPYESPQGEYRAIIVLDRTRSPPDIQGCGIRSLARLWCVRPNRASKLRFHLQRCNHMFRSVLPHPSLFPRLPTFEPAPVANKVLHCASLRQRSLSVEMHG